MEAQEAQLSPNHDYEDDGDCRDDPVRCDDPDRHDDPVAHHDEKLANHNKNQSPTHTDINIEDGGDTGSDSIQDDMVNCLVLVSM